MSIQVLKAGEDEMMKLVRYELGEETGTENGTDIGSLSSSAPENGSANGGD